MRKSIDPNSSRANKDITKITAIASQRELASDDKEWRELELRYGGARLDGSRRGNTSPDGKIIPIPLADTLKGSREEPLGYGESEDAKEGAVGSGDETTTPQGRLSKKTAGKLFKKKKRNI